MRPAARVWVSSSGKYDDVARLDVDEAPTSPWALYLADSAHRYRLLGLDFDDHAATGEAPAEAAQLSAMLDQAGIPHLVCASGGHAGRHIWIRLDGDGISAGEARATAAVLKARWASLDPGPLQNPAWGCLRPPGAPHKHGGHSTSLGDVDAWLTAPPASTKKWQQLAAAIAIELPDALPTGRPAPTIFPVDDDGNPYLPGARRPLSAEVRAVVDAPVDHGVDASARLRTVLVGAAAARWKLADVARELLTTPGLTHATSVRGRGRARIPRAHWQTRAVLARQWARALPRAATVASADDADFVYRASHIAQWIDDLQTRADVTVGRWTTRGGPADRRVLDALCQIALASVKATVDADIRRLALMTGLGRETVRRALHRLSDHTRGEDWITLAKPSAGTLAATWKIDPQSAIHTTLEKSGSQVRPGGLPHDPDDDDPAPDPELLGTGYRAALLAQLRTRNANLCHDVFTPHQIPTLTANLYARIPEEPQLSTLHERFGPTTPDLLALLQDLDLITYSDGTPRHSSDPVALQRAAQHLDVDGVLERRAERYRIERLVRTWFDLEVEWLRTAQAEKRGRRHLPPDQTWLVPPTATDLAGYRYPRKPGGRPDHAQAAVILDGTTRRAPRTIRPDTTSAAAAAAEVILRDAFHDLELVA
ncbi:hypothetical protein [Tessaracoccus flavescens]|uniref:DNA primase/polymerase bifunctional N-terminal domain-containing protein n=1 Tax=Tessaracoccus flavescens TaxID=399497 RepID=A0A1Q2D2T7_9ACTN|nr:hypothetical protein [Tessaracoccus flavescens]AQP52730.1 hypothetical protein BW733_17700 [Tessaracoccus flavescens]